MARLALDEICNAFGAPVPSPAGGSAAAATAAIAASLVVMVGRGSPAWTGGADAAAAAAALRDRLLDLGGEDVDAVAALLAATRDPADRQALDAAVLRAATVPLEIAESAAEVAALAAEAALEGKRPMRADVEAAAALAGTAARIGAAIVTGNLRMPAEGDGAEEVERLLAGARRVVRDVDALARRA